MFTVYKMIQEQFWWSSPDNVFLVTGASNVGKSLVLLHMMVEAMLPKEYGGKGLNVIFLETRMKIKPSRFLSMLEELIRVSDVTIPEKDVTKVANEVLTTKLIIKRIYGWEEMNPCRDFLETVLVHQKSNAPSLFVLDCLSTFYWGYCAQVEPTKKLNFAKKIFELFYKTCLSLNCAFVAGFRIEEDIDLEVDKVHLETIKDKHGRIAYRAHVFQGKSERMIGYRISDTGISWTKPL